MPKIWVIETLKQNGEWVPVKPQFGSMMEAKKHAWAALGIAKKISDDKFRIVKYTRHQKGGQP